MIAPLSGVPCWSDKGIGIPGEVSWFWVFVLVINLTTEREHQQGEVSWWASWSTCLALCQCKTEPHRFVGKRLFYTEVR